MERHSDHAWANDARAAFAVTLISVPQGIAYALIAGLPPAVGLYAGALPAIVGSLLRSSNHVITGPTNAISLIVGTSIAAQASDPVTAAATLALLVGCMQIAAGFLRLSALVDYISSSVVLGYITGAAVLIGVGQLAQVTRTTGVPGDIVTRLVGWVSTLDEAHGVSVAVALGSAATILLLRRLGAPKGSGAITVIAIGMLLAWLLGLDDHGVVLVGGLAPTPSGLRLSVPSLHGVAPLVPVAFAATVLSLVESTSVARSISGRTGQRLDITREFLGQGAANVMAAFSGAYPVSGSLSRSGLNERAGATTRFAGAMSGAMMLAVLLAFGPVVDYTPVPSLAGLLLVVAADLIDWERIKTVLSAGWGDRLGFLATVIGTWTLPLDQAVYLGVGVSIVLFLRRARLLVTRELLVDRDLRLHEAPCDDAPAHLARCGAIRILHVEGPLFFGAAGELDDALRNLTRDPKVKVVIVRVKRTQGLDLTTALVLADTERRLRAEGRSLLLVGLREDAVHRLEDMGLDEVFGEDLFPTRPGWFVAMNTAIEEALTRVGAHGEEACPLEAYVDHRHEVERVAR